MKFYDCQTAPSPRRVRMFIAEKGVDIESIQVDLGKAEQLQPEFLKINPRATVPVLLLDDGSCLVSTAGCRAYLEGEFPTPALLGTTSEEMGRIADLIAQIEADGLMAIAECLRNSARGMKGRAMTGTKNYEQIPELAERGRDRMTRFMPTLNDLIGDQPFIAGDTFSAADIDAFITVEFAKWIKVGVPDDCVNITRWRNEMSNRESGKL